jgi:hypothetical protein
MWSITQFGALLQQDGAQEWQQIDDRQEKIRGFAQRQPYNMWALFEAPGAKR